MNNNNLRVQIKLDDTENRLRVAEQTIAVLKEAITNLEKTLLQVSRQGFQKKMEGSPAVDERYFKKEEEQENEEKIKEEEVDEEEEQEEEGEEDEGEEEEEGVDDEDLLDAIPYDEDDWN
ncbi:hypothetical protein ABW19_dt0205284 [Dactylella cylindrospora]|nr:hypothetical protein ABW19_dt0205284 [Dactylella cylindrospora]